MARQMCVCVCVCVCALEIRKLPLYCGGHCYFPTVKIISCLKLICPKKRQLQITCQSGVLDITVWKKWYSPAFILIQPFSGPSYVMYGPVRSDAVQTIYWTMPGHQLIHSERVSTCSTAPWESRSPAARCIGIQDLECITYYWLGDLSRLAYYCHLHICSNWLRMLQASNTYCLRTQSTIAELLVIQIHLTMQHKTKCLVYRNHLWNSPTDNMWSLCTCSNSIRTYNYTRLYT